MKYFNIILQKIKIDRADILPFGLIGFILLLIVLLLKVSIEEEKQFQESIKDLNCIKTLAKEGIYVPSMVNNTFILTYTGDTYLYKCDDDKIFVR